jgi:hypothetical protein
MGPSAQGLTPALCKGLHTPVLGRVCPACRGRLPGLVGRREGLPMPAWVPALPAWRIKNSQRVFGAFQYSQG